MIGKNRTITTSVVLITIVLCSIPAYGFELFPRPVGETHTVKRGNTLYSLAEQFYHNGDLWPFLWNQNPNIKLSDPNTPPEKALLPSGAKINIYDMKNPYTMIRQQYRPPNGLPDDLLFLTTLQQLKGIPYEKRYFGYKLTPRPTQVWGYIFGGPEQHKTYFLERDLVYINFRPSKKQAILVGDRFGVYREKGPVPHPINPDKSIGYQAEIVGEVEVVSTGNDLISAIVLESFSEIVRGDKISIFAARQKEIVPSKTHRLLTGTILAGTRDAFMGATYGLENDVVFIDRGECDGMKDGMLLNIYRPSHPEPDPYFGRRMTLPDRHIGEGMVLKAFDKNATVIITLSKEEILPGYIIKTVSD